ncbi:MAG: response regulator, partial [Rhodocyclales bacterium]|nr:response regulator [Rhodocyclales bacterium]
RAQLAQRVEEATRELAGQRDAAERANAAKSRFLAAASHDLRQPLHALGLFITDLQRQIRSDNRSLLPHITEQIAASTEALGNLLNSLLDISRLDVAGAKPDVRNFPLAPLFDRLSAAFRPSLNERQLRLRMRPGSYWVHSDPVMLERMIGNLLANAIRYTPVGGRILIGSRYRSGQVSIEVRDSGIGIPEEKCASIFEAFTQADTSTTRHYGGTGLGLSITSRLVSLMDGKIWVESTLGKGSTFHVEIPLCLPTEQVVIQFDTSRIIGKRALIIDDNQVNRRIFKEMLTRWGLHVEEEPSALALLKNLQTRRQQTFDLLVIDYHMPGMDGFELTEYLNRSRDFGTAKIVMFSSALLPGLVARSQALGVAAYLTKPIDRYEFFRVLNEIFTPASTSPELRSEAIQTAGEPHAEPSLNILVAEDNPINQKLIRTLLNKKGHQVTVAENGALAIERFQASSFDIVLMDLQMPVIGGLDAARIIRAWEAQHDRPKSTPIYALSAAVLPEVQKRAIEAGIDGFLGKPIDKLALYAVLTAICAQQASAEASANAL